MWWLWIVGYLGVAIATGIFYGRSEVKSLIADPNKFRHPKRGDDDYEEPRYGHSYQRQITRTEEERIRRCAESVFWESWWTGVAWPLALGAVGIYGIWTGTTYVFAGKELKEARKKDEAAKAEKILKDWEREQFKELE